ncbi:hypothetical protein Droror1_Dr00005851 [Drosera rotundifolia]
MAWRVGGGSLTRSLISASRAASLRPSPPLLRRLRPPPLSSPRRRLPFSPSRNFGELGCLQSFLPLRGAPCLTSHVMVGARACCELYHGIVIIRACQDR